MIKSQDPKRYIYGMIYGFNAGFTTFICIIYDIFTGQEHQLNGSEIIQLVGIYLPYLLIPIVIMVDNYNQLVNRLVR